MRKISREIVSALILSKDGKLLLDRKDPTQGGVYPDCWHIPGGGLHDRENILAGLTREVREETGIEITTAQANLEDDEDYGESEKTLEDTRERVLCKMHFNVFRVDLNQNAEDIQTQPGSDFTELRWFSSEELEKVNLTPPLHKLLRKLDWVGK